MRYFTVLRVVEGRPLDLMLAIVYESIRGLLQRCVLSILIFDIDSSYWESANSTM